jgi:phage antirepressor YoqD-like protein
MKTESHVAFNKTYINSHSSDTISDIVQRIANLSIYEDELFDIMPESKAFYPYHISDVASLLFHPKVNGRNKLFKFLREEGIFEDGEPVQKYIDLGYFVVDNRYTRSGIYVGVPMVSSMGVKYIKQLVLAKLGSYEMEVKKPRKTKTGKLTNLNTLLK